MAPAPSTFLRRWLAALANRWAPFVPAELDACEGGCREVDCTRARFETCPLRLARLARLRPRG